MRRGYPTVLQHPARPGDQRAGAGRGRRPRRRARARGRRAVPDAGPGAAHLHRRAAADGAAAVHQPAHPRRRPLQPDEQRHRPDHDGRRRAARDSPIRSNPLFTTLRTHRKIDHLNVVTSSLPPELSNAGDFSRSSIEARIRAGHQDAMNQGIGDVDAPGLRFGMTGPTSNRSPPRADRPRGHRASTQDRPVTLRTPPPATPTTPHGLPGRRRRTPWSQLGVAARDRVADTPRTHTSLEGGFRPPGRVRIHLIGLTRDAMPEGFRGPVRISVGDEVRELGAGDSGCSTCPNNPSQRARAT